MATKFLDNTGLAYLWGKMTNKINNAMETKQDKVVTLTQAEYDALPTATKENGTIYFISDAPAAKSLTIDNIYPVGSVYISVNNTNPATFIGGTWVQINDVFLLSAGTNYTAGDTGGEAEHTLTIDEMPKHNHGVYYRAIYPDSGKSWGVDPGTRGSANDGLNSIQFAGGGLAHNNMPPYLVVYMWKRTA